MLFNRSENLLEQKPPFDQGDGLFQGGGGVILVLFVKHKYPGAVLPNSRPEFSIKIFYKC